MEYVSVGFPVAEKYARPHAPELASGKAYCPLAIGLQFFEIQSMALHIFYSVILFA